MLKSIEVDSGRMYIDCRRHEIDAVLIKPLYYGQTSRALKTRVKEHSNAIATLDKNSLLAKHHIINYHQINLQNVRIVDRSSEWKRMLILEAWHSIRDNNTIMNTYRCQTYNL